MKKTKFIISSFIIFFGFLFIGENYQFYINNFQENFYYTSIYIQDYTTEEEMKSDILKEAKAHNIEFFTVVNTIESTLLQKIDIYGTGEIEEELNTKYDIYEKDYPSLLTGETRVKFHDFKDLSTIENQSDYYCIGDETDIQNFKRALVNKYAGKIPKKGKDFNHQEVYGVWILISIVILLLSMYDVAFQKKENSIKISLGESIGVIILKNVLLDIGVYTSIFIVSIMSLYKTTSVLFGINISMGAFIVFLLINSCMYFSLYFNDLRKMLTGAKVSKKLLATNYVLKFITIIMTTAILASNIAIIFEGYSFYKQKSFFEEHKDYEYVNLYYKAKLDSDGNVVDNLDETFFVEEDFYNKFYEKFNAIELTNKTFYGSDHIMILTSKNTLPYLKENIKEMNNRGFDKDYYFLIPEESRGEESSIVEEIKGSIGLDEGHDLEYSYDIIYYKDDINIIGIDSSSTNGSKSAENPTIIHKNNINGKWRYQDGERYPKYAAYKETMYKVSDKEFDEFVNKHNLQNEVASRTNVLENYLYHLEIVKRAVFISFILSILTLLLEVILIKSILMLEYEVNAVELSVKKVLGYNLFEKNFKILAVTMGITSLSIIASVIVGEIFNISEAYYLLVSGVLIAVAEIATILFYVKKLEKANLQKILKGGNL